MALNSLSFMVPWTKPADQWSIDKAKEMRAQGYNDGVIIRKLEAYGIGWEAAKAVVRSMRESE